MVMPLRTEHTVVTYTLDDHPDPQACIDWVRHNWHDMYSWGEENVAALRAFCQHFDLNNMDYNVSICSHSYACASVWLDDDGEDVVGLLLYQHLLSVGVPEGDCPFTGYYIDDVLLRPIRDFMAKPQLLLVTFQQLVDECLSAWVSAYIADWEYAYSDEAIRETCEANEYQFTESGEFYSN